jgi:hypothetical protein
MKKKICILSYYCKNKLIDITFNFYFKYIKKDNYILIKKLKDKINEKQKTEKQDVIGCGVFHSYIYDGFIFI